MKNVAICVGLLTVFIGYVIWVNQPKKLPDEAKTAHKALQKLQAATQTGVTFFNYEQLLIDAKTAVNVAETKLPVVQSPKVLKDGYDYAEEFRFESVNFQMQKAMEAFLDAKTAWRHKITNTKLADTPEGKALLSKYVFLISSNDDADAATQKLWSRADDCMNTLQRLIDN